MHTLRNLVLWCLCASAGAATSDAVDGALGAWRTWIDGQIDLYQRAVDGAQHAYSAEKAKLDAAAIAGLMAIGRREARKPDKAVALVAWAEVLRLDGAHTEAVGFFTALGQLEQVRAELDGKAASETDLLGSAENPPPLPEPVQGELRQRKDGLGKARAAFAKSEGAARTRFREAENKARAKVLKDLGALAQKAERAGDLPGATAAWKGVLLLDREDARARTFFTGLGRLDAVLAELPPAHDPLGDPPDPDRGFAPVSLRGLKVLITGSDNPEKQGAFERALRVHCEAAGMVVTSAAIGSLREEAGTALLKDQQLVILASGVSDATRHGCIPLVRTLRVPLIMVDLKLAELSGLTPGPSYNGHLNEYTASVLMKAPGGHPLAAGLGGSVRLLDPATATAPAKPLPVEQDPDVLRVYAPVLDLPPGAIPVIGLERERSVALLAWDTGHTITVGESKAGEAVTAKLPARRLGCWLFGALRPEQAPRLSRDFWRLWDANLTWMLRGAIAPEAKGP